MLIAAKDLALGYSGVPAAWDITLDVQAGEGLALIGPNGSGKTTLLRAVLGDVRILSGTLEVGASTIGYVPQNNDLDPTFPVSAREVVTMGLYGELGWGSRPGRAHRARVEEALERVGMAERASMRFGRLSGGQRQRILVARALVARPQLTGEAVGLLAVGEGVSETGTDDTVAPDTYTIPASERPTSVSRE